MRGIEIFPVGCCFILLCTVSGFVVSAAPSLADQCGAEFQKVTTCLAFATGKADSPSKECCTSVGEIKDKNPVCLCYFIQQIHSGNNDQIKSMGIQEARLLQLPSACKLSNASTAECPQLLHLAPNSPDAAIFTNSTSASSAPATTSPTGTGTSSATKADDKGSGFANSVSLPWLTALLSVAMAVNIYFSFSAFPAEGF